MGWGWDGAEDTGWAEPPTLTPRSFSPAPSSLRLPSCPSVTFRIETSPLLLLSVLIFYFSSNLTLHTSFITHCRNVFLIWG